MIERLRRVFICVAVGGAPLGCSASKMPDPEAAKDAYLDAAARGDVKKLRAMMTERAAQELSERELARLLKRDAEEFAERRKVLRDEVREAGRAQLFFEDGSTASLSLENGEFRVESAGLVNPRPRSPEEAVQRLRDAVRSRDFGRLLDSLTDESAAALADSLERLNHSLEDLGTAIIDVRENRATVEFADGRVLLLRRENAVWKVEEIQ